MKLTSCKPGIFESFDEPNDISMKALRRKERAIEHEMEQLDDTLAKAKATIQLNVRTPKQQEELQALVKVNNDRYEILRQRRDEVHDSMISLKKLDMSL